MRKNWIVYGLVILLAFWIFHVHFNRGVPVKRGGK